jgi:hypothetical protein
VIESIAPSASHYLTQTIRWDGNALSHFSANHAFILDLQLNNSDESSLGPGIFLDLDSLVIRTDLPGWYIHGLGDPWSYYRSLAIGTLSPVDLTADLDYHVFFSSAPGTAREDNANLVISRGTKWLPGCQWSWCVYERDRCQVNAGEWTVAPLPGLYTWPPPAERTCYHWFTYLPTVLSVPFLGHQLVPILSQTTSDDSTNSESR